MACRSGRLQVGCIGHALKESLSPSECAVLLREAVRAAHVECVAALCISDGGDGFLEAAQSLYPAAVAAEASVRPPHGARVRAAYLFDASQGMVIIESAQAVGLRLVPPAARSILALGTGGLGELIVAAWQRGGRRFFIGLGGSATCDAGIGMLALLHDVFVRKLPLSRARWLTAADLPSFFPQEIVDLRLALQDEKTEIIAAADVDSPLIGPQGAAHRFAPQKGATSEETEWLEHQLTIFSEKLAPLLGDDLSRHAGAGAAGGLGMAFLALGACLQPGAQLFLQSEDFNKLCASSDLVITAEGRFDRTSLGGKAPWQVATEVRRRDRRAAIICAQADDVARDEASRRGIDIIEFAPGLPFSEAAPRTRQLMTESLTRYLLALQ